MSCELRALNAGMDINGYQWVSGGHGWIFLEDR